MVPYKYIAPSGIHSTEAEGRLLPVHNSTSNAPPLDSLHELLLSQWVIVAYWSPVMLFTQVCLYVTSTMAHNFTSDDNFIEFAQRWDEKLHITFSEAMGF